MNHCAFCGGELVEQLTTFVNENDGQVQIVRNVPSFVCSRCGEKEYSLDTTRRLLKLLKKSPRPVEILHVPAYDMASGG